MKLRSCFEGAIEEGKLILKDRDAFDQMTQAAGDGQVLYLSVSRERPRQLGQFRYYYGTLLPILRDALVESRQHIQEQDGRMREPTTNDCDAFLKNKCLKRYSNTPFEQVPSKADLNALELQVLIERGRTYILETWGLYVPPYNGWKPGYTIDNGVNTYDGDIDIQHEAG